MVVDETGVDELGCYTMDCATTGEKSVDLHILYKYAGCNFWVDVYIFWLYITSKIYTSR